MFSKRELNPQRDDYHACSFHVHDENDVSIACCVLVPMCSFMSTPHHRISGFHRSHNRSVGRITLSLFAKNVTDFFFFETTHFKASLVRAHLSAFFLDCQLRHVYQSVRPHGTNTSATNGWIFMKFYI
jgi:hypothetical protein